MGCLAASPKLPPAVQSCVLGPRATVELGKLGAVPWATQWFLLGEEAVAGRRQPIAKVGAIRVISKSYPLPLKSSPWSVRFKILY